MIAEEEGIFLGELIGLLAVLERLTPKPRCRMCAKPMTRYYEPEGIWGKFCSKRCIRQWVEKSKPTGYTCDLCGKAKLEFYIDEESGKRYCTKTCLRNAAKPVCCVCDRRVRSKYYEVNGEVYCTQKCYRQSHPGRRTRFYDYEVYYFDPFG